MLYSWGLPFVLVTCIRRVLFKPKGFINFSYDNKHLLRLFDEQRLLGKLIPGQKDINGASYDGEMDENYIAFGLGELTFNSGARAFGTFVSN